MYWTRRWDQNRYYHSGSKWIRDAAVQHLSHYATETSPGFGFFVLWHINLCRLFNAKAILQEEEWWYYLTHTWEDKGVHTFPKGICPKVNVIAQLEYELTYYDFAVHRFNHYTSRTPPTSPGEGILCTIK